MMLKSKKCNKKFERGVIHIVPTDRLGGTERNALRLLEESEKYGIESVMLLTKSDRKGPLVDHPKAQIVKDKTIGEQIYRFNLKCEKVFLIYHFFGFHVFKKLVEFGKGNCKLIVVQGNAFDNGINGLKQLIVLILIKVFGAKVVAVSRHVQQSVPYPWLFKYLLTVIYNGIDIKNLSREIDDKRKINICGKKSSKIFGMMSRLDPIKDHVTLIYAFHNYLLNYPDSAEDLLLIEGEGSNYDPLKKLIDDLGIANNVTLSGRSADTIEFFATIDVFIFSTTYKEGFGNVLIEAMCAEIPIICSDVGPCREVLGISQAYYYSPQNIEELTNLIIMAKNNQLKKSSKIAIEDKFAISKMLADYLK